MKPTSLHLNLLRDSERLSSSPVRFRVMMPVLALLACAAGLIWWGMLATQLLMVKTQTSSLRADLDGKKAAHAAILAQMADAREKELELEQLRMYDSARRTCGETLAHLAGIMPLRVQLTSLSIPEPPPQELGAQPGRPAPWGPTSNVEKVSLRIVGRTTKETPVISMMESLEGPAFTNFVKTLKDPRSPDASPKVHSFRQDAVSGVDGVRLLVFDIEYRCAERRYGE